jgi:hypothetical protein
VKLKKEVATKGVANFTQEEFDTLKITLMKTIDSFKQSLMR